MYVCVCRAITEEQVRRAVAGGADTLAKLRATLGLGVDCARCLEYAKRFLDDGKPGDGDSGGGKPGDATPGDGGLGNAQPGDNNHAARA